MSLGREGERITLTDFQQTETWDVVRGVIVENPEVLINLPLLSSDGATLFTEVLNGDTHMLLVKNDTTDITLTYNDGYGGVYSADMRPNGEYIVGASLYHRIYVWDAQTGEQLPDLNW